MTDLFKQIISYTLVTTLAGCVGGGTPAVTQPVVPDVFPITRFSELSNLSEQLDTLASGQRFSELDRLPTNGSAEFNGVLTVMGRSGQMNGIGLLGSLAMQVNWAQTEVTVDGMVSRIFTDAGETVVGNLDMENGRFDLDGDPNIDRTLTGVFRGVLDLPGAKNTDFDLAVEGDFLGSQVLIAGGGIFGVARTPSAQSQLLGRFIAVN